MKAIVFILIIVTSVAAKKMRACAFIHANNAKINSGSIGKLRFTQSSPTQNIVIKGRIKKLPPKEYVVVVHEDYDTSSKSCNALGFMKEVSPGVLLTLANVKIEEPKIRKGHSIRGELDSEGRNTRRRHNSNEHVSKYTRIEGKIAEHGTLVENQPTSIIGYSIAFHDASTFSYSRDIPSIPNVACGFVIEGPACD